MNVKGYELQERLQFSTIGRQLLEKANNALSASVDAKAIREQALEEAAKVCQRYHDKLEELGKDDYQTGRGRGAIDCAAAIRGLK